MRSCAFNTSAGSVFVDHISPLASLLQIPLIVTDEANAQLTAKYYPEVELRFWPDLEFRFKELAEEFDALIECDFWAPHLKELFRTLYRKEMQLIICSHGQSDKGYGAPVLSRFAHQEMIYLYGDLFREMLTELKIPVHSSRVVGNFRLQYYRKHQERLQALAEKEIFSQFKANSRTILYAPTWRDLDESTSFFEHSQKLVADLPPDWNLLIKLHPHLSQKDPALFYRLQFLERENLKLIEEFPPIYPLLDRVDAYLGDYSSVGYDFLAFQKPLFFLPKAHLPRGRLHQCGRVILEGENVFDVINRSFQEEDRFHSARRALYAKAFAEVEL